MQPGDFSRPLVSIFGVFYSYTVCIRGERRAECGVLPRPWGGLLPAGRAASPGERQVGPLFTATYCSTLFKPTVRLIISAKDT